jgi:O-antigen/teichoic acid export membrane protein
VTASGPSDGLTSPAQPTGAVRATSIVGIGMMTMNVLAYAFTLLAAHVLGPTDFGAVGALLGILIVANVGALSLQATAARRLATVRPGHLAGVVRDVRRSSWALAAALAATLLVASPVIDRLLHLDDLVAAAMVALACLPLTVTGGYAGIVQGERRWTELAWVYVAMGAGRVVGGGLGLAVSASPRGAMFGVTIGAVVPAVLGAWFCRTAATPAERHQPIVGELWRNGHTLLAFFMFTNVDVLLARHLLTHHEAGIYAAGAIISKTCLFLPTFVLVAAFPTMAADRSRRAWVRPLLAVLGLGLLAVVGTWLLPGLAVAFAGGSAYVDLGPVAWVFALEGTVFAALQILVYETIAGQRHAAFVLWIGAGVVVVGAVVFVSTVTALVSLVTLVAAGAALVTGLMPGATDSD